MCALVTGVQTCALPISLFLTVFSIGIGIGSIGCDRLLKGEVSARTVPFGALGMAVFSIDLYFASAGVTPAAAPALAEPLGALAFLGQAGHWRILADLLLVSMLDRKSTRLNSSH